VTTLTRSRRKTPPKVTHPAGSPQAIAIVRAYIALMRDRDRQASAERIANAAVRTPRKRAL
jgi:hypothetical protein